MGRRVGVGVKRKGLARLLSTMVGGYEVIWLLWVWNVLSGSGSGYFGGRVRVDMV